MKLQPFSIPIAKFIKPFTMCFLVFIFSGLALFSMLAFLTPAQAGSGEWTLQGSTPGGTSVLSIAVNPELTSTLYAGTYYGVYKSVDGGEHWISSTHGLQNSFGDIAAINAIVIDPVISNTIYAGGGGVFKSVNGGESWVAAHEGITTTYVWTISIDPKNPATLYAGTMGYDSQGGIFKSIDGGQSWEAANSGLPIPAYVYSIIIDPQNTDILYAGLGPDGIYKSSNAGETWDAVNTDSSLQFNRVLAMDPVITTTLYVGTADQGILKSIDGGSVFTPTNQGLNSTSVTAIWLADSTTIYAGTENSGLYKSTDAGASWVYSSFGMHSSYIQALTGVGEDPVMLYAGTKAGVVKTQDGGLSWEEANHGLLAAPIEVLILPPQQSLKLYAGTAGGGVYTYQRSDWISNSIGISNTWVSNSVGLSNTWIRSMAYDPITPTTFYAGTFFGGVYKSIDGGTHWMERNDGLPLGDVRALIVHPLTSTIVYAGGSDGIFKSLDGGASWEETDSGIPVGYANISSLAMDTNNPEVLYAGVIGYGVFTTTNSGQDWHASSEGLAGLLTTKLAVNPYESSIVYVGTEGPLFRSIDRGATWEPTNLIGATSILFDPVMTDTLYAGTGGNGLYISVNDGLEWQPITTNGFPNGVHYIYDLEYNLDTGELYAATMTGVELSQPAQHKPALFGQKALVPAAPPRVVMPQSYGVYALCVSEKCEVVESETIKVFLPFVITSQ